MFSFSAAELWFLLKQFAPTIIIGLEDPTVGLLDYEIADLELRSQVALVEKGYITPSNLGKWQLNDLLANYINTLANPSDTIFFVGKHCTEEKETVKTYHFTKASPVIGLLKRPNTLYNIKEVRDVRTEMEQDILDPLLTKIYINREEPPFVLEEGVLNQIKDRKNIEDEGVAFDILGNNGLSISQSKRLLYAYKTPIFQCSLMIFKDRNKPVPGKLIGFSLLVSEEDIWIMKLQENQNYQIGTISKYDLNTHIQNIVLSVEAQ